MNLSSYLGAIARHWIILILTTLIGAGTGLGVALSTPKTYEASAQVLFSAKVGTNGQDLAYAGSYVQGRMPTYRRLGESPTVLELTARSLKTGVTVKQLKRQTDIEVLPSTSIVKIHATDRSKARAIKTADTLAGAIRLAVEGLENPKKGEKALPVGVSGVVIGSGKRDTVTAAPKMPLYVAVGAVTGLLIGFGAASLREAMGRRKSKGSRQKRQSE